VASLFRHQQPTVERTWVSLDTCQTSDWAFAILVDGFFEVATRRSLVAMRSQQKINRLAGLVHCVIEVFPVATDLQ